MCGIFGLVAGSDSAISQQAFFDLSKSLFQLSETRGKEAAGLAVCNAEAIGIFKEAVPASTMIRSDRYTRFLERYAKAQFPPSARSTPFAAIGHSRLVTNGMQGIAENNQPVSSGDVVVVHNGIVVNVDDLWERFPELPRTANVDTEVIAALLNSYLQQGRSLPDATKAVFALIRGEASIAVFFRQRQELLLATNTGSLFSASAQGSGLFAFVSEKYIFDQFARGSGGLFEAGSSTQCPAGHGMIVDLAKATSTTFSLVEDGKLSAPCVDTGLAERRRIEDTAGQLADLRAGLQRCSRCLLPETMPFIGYDGDGVCNYCHNYKPIVPKGQDDLEEILSKYRRSDDEADCLVAFSGGRDSSYGLHLLVEEYGMSPVAYTYDWGMVTDLARRNQARLCGQLGIEHLWLSADIKAKRRNIRHNVEAWLKRPDLGMIPLFMAGDKQFFYYANKLKEQMGIKLMVFCTNRLEKTDFKTGFVGMQPKDSMENQPSMFAMGDKLKLLRYYGTQYLLNPGYINRSIFDTLWAFSSYYIITQDHLYLFDYLDWDEDHINETLIGKYDWETATDTNSTWRIGDGTAPFYNYIYLTVCGFTEHDTFRSNQIREGLISREEGMRLVEEENVPRWDSIREYTQMIGVDFDEAIRVIDAVPKLYAPA